MRKIKRSPVLARRVHFGTSLRTLLSSPLDKPLRYDEAWVSHARRCISCETYIAAYFAVAAPNDDTAKYVFSARFGNEQLLELALR